MASHEESVLPVLPSREPIAIAGIGCRFPGARGPDEFWDLLVGERSAIGEVPADRFDVDALHDPRPGTPGKMTTRYGGFLDDVYGFDAEFFRLSPRETSRIDPQQRALLEVSAEALGDAFVTRDELSRHVAGVFIGSWDSDWEAHQYADRRKVDLYTVTGSARCLLPGRVSFAFDLRGPSVSVDAGCAASLYAVHQACQSLWLGESTLALAGGVNLILDPAWTISLSQANMMAPDGRCKTFDERADGFVRSEGCGVVVLMPVSTALARRARIYAVIRGTGASNDGATNGLQATPSEIGQGDAIRAAYRAANLSPRDVQYIETHGTGTRAGDPVEVRAIAAAMADRPRDRPCLVGSVKTNIGHTEGAAGIAGFIKTALAIHNRVIPRSLNFQTPTPHIAWDEIAVAVADRTMPWPAGLARAGVSSFGIGGTDVHAVIEELPAVAHRAGPPPDGRAELIVLSAAGPAALAASAAAHRDLLARDPGEASALADVCFTAGVGRDHHDHRLAAVGSRGELIEALDAHARGDVHPQLFTGTAGETGGPVFVFSGHGSQWDGMGRELLADQPVFRDAIAACDRALRAHTDWSLMAELTRERRGDAPRPLDVIQPSLFAMQVGLAALWRSWGVVPALVVGHSLGEIAAAHVAGALSLDDAALIVCRRSQLLRRLSGQGSMLSVELPFDRAAEIAARHAGKVSVAVSNSTSSTVLSGDTHALAEIERELQEGGVFCRALKADGAGHSPQLDPLLPELAAAVAGVAPDATAAVPICSAVTGAVVPPGSLTADHWVRNLRQPVRFSTAMQTAVAAGHSLFLEISPHPLLVGAVQQTLREAGRSGHALGSLRRSEPERATLLGALGQMHVLGARVRHDALYPESARFVALPRYPWQRDEPAPGEVRPGASAVDAPARDAGSLGDPISSALQPNTFLWQTSLSIERSTYLADHAVHGTVMLAGASFVDMAMQAAERVFETRDVAVDQVSFTTAVVVPSGSPVPLQVALSIDRPGTAAIRFCTPISAGPGAPPRWTVHATASAHRLDQAAPRPAAVDLAAVAARCQERAPHLHYRAIEERGGRFGPAFRGMEALWIGEGEALARIALPDGVAWREGDFIIHPAALDACWQALAAVLFDGAPGRTLYLPIGVESARRWANPERQLWAHAVLRAPTGGDEVTGDVRILGASGDVLLETRGLALRPMAPAAELDTWLYEPRWTRREPTRREPPAAPTGVEPNTWLVLSDRRGVAARLIALLERSGARCIAVRAAGPGEAAVAGDGGAVDPTDAAALRELVGSAAGRPDRPLRGAIDLWPLDAVTTEEASPDSLGRAQELGAVGLANLARALGETGLSRLRLVAVTCAAQSPVAGQPVEIAQAPVWALARVLRYEMPELATSCVDLGLAAPDEELDVLFGELSRLEDEVAVRGGDCFLRRLVHAAPADDAPVPTRPRRAGGAPGFRLETTAAGILDELRFREADRRRPGPGEVEIEVSAGGLNFLDVMRALGVGLPTVCERSGSSGTPAGPGEASGPLAFGFECAGTIRAIGEGAVGFEIGQRVAAVAEWSRGCLARFVVTPAALVVPCPPDLDDAQAAALPIAYLTAIYAMERLGRLAAGERVLIHCATGGVGLAAIHVARRAGAIVFATAGSQDKRDFLRAMGVEHVFDSRSLSFAPAIRRATGGEGVDMVLNSLAGDALTESLALLRPDGRFLEIGKRDIYEDRALGLLPFRRGLTFAHVDIARLIAERPLFMGELLRDLFRAVAAGELAPLPVDVRPASDAAGAFRQMAQARHIGKLVLSFADPALSASVEPSRPAIAREGATYLVTGGLGGIGLVVAEWLAKQGARHLALWGRRAPGLAAEAVLERLRRAGVQVDVRACDVSRSDDVAAELARIESAMPPLAGIVHAAAVLDDGLAAQLTPERFARVMAPKMLGAWNLHVHSRELPLDFFVLFSSAASTLGSPGQGNYAAANEFMDALARHRRARGLTALTVNWGPWGESGAGVSPDRAGRLGARGVGAMTDAEGTGLLGRLIRADRTEAAVIPSADWRQWSRFYPAAAAMGMFEELLREESPAAPAPAGEPDALAQVLAAPAADRPGLIEAYLVEQMRRVLRLPASRAVDARLPLNRFGIDSLMAVELRNRIDADLGVAIAISKLLLSPGVSRLAHDLVQLLPDRSASAAPAERAAPDLGESIEQILDHVDRLDGADATVFLDDLLDDEQTSAQADRS